MKKCTIVIKDEVNCKIQDLELDDRKHLSKMFEYEQPGARYSSSVRLGRWNGKISYFSISGTTYVNLLDKIIPYLCDVGYEIDIDDNRRHTEPLTFNPVAVDTFSHICWPKGHDRAGEPIIFRDYQCEIINQFLSNTSSMQEVATGAGKCLVGDTKLKIWIGDVDFSEYVNHYSYSSARYITTYEELASNIEGFLSIKLKHNQEVDISAIPLFVNTPSGFTKINYFIMKDDQPIWKVVLSTGYSFECSAQHLVVTDTGTKHVSDLTCSDMIVTEHGEASIASVENLKCTKKCFDIGIDSPHLYYDAHGVLHHNTLITAGLSKLVEEHGRSIVIVPNKSLVVQTEADYINLGLDTGVYFGGRKETTKRHTICTWQSLNNVFKRTSDEYNPYSQTDLTEDVIAVIVDEAHSAKANILKTLLTGPYSNVPIRWGLTGTVPKEDISRTSLLVSIGPVINQLAAHTLQDKGVLARCHVHIKQLKDDRTFANYQSELKFLTSDSERMDKMAEMIQEIAATGNTLVLIDRKEAGKELINRIPNAVFMNGDTKLSDRKDEYDDIAVANDKILICTYGIAAVGINAPRIFNLVLIEPGKSFVRVIQSIGRGIRKAHDKDMVDIWDITSNCKFAKRHLTQRKSFYTEAKYDFTMDKIAYRKH